MITEDGIIIDDPIIGKYGTGEELIEYHKKNFPEKLLVSKQATIFDL